MRMTSNLFSLTCNECGAMSDIESIDQALAEGWTGIDYALHLQTANFAGLCPSAVNDLGIGRQPRINLLTDDCLYLFTLERRNLP